MEEAEQGAGLVLVDAKATDNTTDESLRKRKNDTTKSDKLKGDQLKDKRGEQKAVSSKTINRNPGKDDPLFWFGLLPPSALREGQKDFKKGEFRAVFIFPPS